MLGERRCQTPHLRLSFGANGGSGPTLRHASNGLRRLAQHPQEGPAHALLVAEAGLGGDDANRVAALLDHQARGVEPEAFDRLGGRGAGLGAEGAAELARAEPGDMGEVLDG